MTKLSHISFTQIFWDSISFFQNLLINDCAETLRDNFLIQQVHFSYYHIRGEDRGAHTLSEERPLLPPARLWLPTWDCWCNLASQPKQMQSRKVKYVMGTMYSGLGTHWTQCLVSQHLGTTPALLNKVFPASMPGTGWRYKQGSFMLRSHGSMPPSTWAPSTRGFNDTNLSIYINIPHNLFFL